MNTDHKLFSNGIQLDTSPSAFGWLTHSNDSLDNVAKLREQLHTEGYLYLKNFIDPAVAASTRTELLKPIFEENPEFNKNGKVGNKNFKEVKNSGDVPLVRNLIHSGKIPDFFSRILGGPSRPYDLIWSRVVGQGRCETPHCDTVYMNRGTKNLYTIWVPLGDIPLQNGPLMILEKSHRLESLDSYRSLDIDSDFNKRKITFKHGRFFRGFHYSRNPRKVQKEFGKRWLTANFYPGDVIIFSVHALHCTLDNFSDSFRVVVDARFQLASELIDSRYVGTNPFGHGNFLKPLPRFLYFFLKHFGYRNK